MALAPPLTSTEPPSIAGLHAALAACVVLMQQGQVERAATTLAALDQSATTGFIPASLCQYIIQLRLQAARKLAGVVSEQTLWDLLTAIDASGFPSLVTTRAGMQTQCAIRAATVLEAGNCVRGTDFAAIIRWRRRLAALGPDRLFNWARLAMALTHARRPAEAERLIAQQVGPVAAYLARTVGRAPHVMRALQADGRSLYAQEAPSYLAAGLPVIPTIGETGYPARWQDYATAQPDRRTLARWNRIRPTQIGLVVGPASGVTLVALGTTNPELTSVLAAALPRTPWRREGRLSHVFAYCRSNAPVLHATNEDGEAVLTVLADGALVMLPPSIQLLDGTPFRAAHHLAAVAANLPGLPTDLDLRIARSAAKAGYTLSIRVEPSA